MKTGGVFCGVLRSVYYCSVYYLVNTHFIKMNLKIECIILVWWSETYLFLELKSGLDISDENQLASSKKIFRLMVYGSREEESCVVSCGVYTISLAKCILLYGIRSLT